MMQVYLETSKGKNKDQSEDYVLVDKTICSDAHKIINFQCGNVVVADGVGGSFGGAKAAQIVCQKLSEVSQPKAADFSAINNIILEEGKKNSEYSAMATAVSGLSIEGNAESYIFHVGNTRIYAIKAGRYLKQLTTDDTVVDFLIKTNRLTESEAQSYPARNEITACFGGGKQELLKLKLLPVDMENDQIFLLTSDGVHDYLSIDEIEDIIDDANGDWERFVNNLVQTAKDHGSIDDCTAMIVECVEQEKSHVMEKPVESQRKAQSVDIAAGQSAKDERHEKMGCFFNPFHRKKDKS